MVRERYFDLQLENVFLDQICQQLVILGSGNDMRALRLGFLKKHKIFEVDFSEQIQAKQAILKKVLGKVPQQVVYVEDDVTRPGLVGICEHSTAQARPLTATSASDSPERAIARSRPRDHPAKSRCPMVDPQDRMGYPASSRGISCRSATGAPFTRSRPPNAIRFNSKLLKMDNPPAGRWRGYLRRCLPEKDTAAFSGPAGAAADDAPDVSKRSRQVREVCHTACS